jgi:D-inositol-3-phosphate glycosyltransferase
LKVALITGGAPHYEAGLVSGLIEQNLELEVLGGPELSANHVFRHSRVKFHRLESERPLKTSLLGKALGVLGVYGRMIKYAWKSPIKIFHLQWPYKIVLFDRTLLAVYYRLLGKKIIFTAHNVDGFAHGKSSLVNHLSLKFFYRMTDHLIVHTERMKRDLEGTYGVASQKISIIPHGVMDAVPETALSGLEARKKLGIEKGAKVILAFGLITPYKGLELLVGALNELKRNGEVFTLVIAGRIKECQSYWDEVQREIKTAGLENSLILKLGHIPDEEVEIYFKAADLLVLPYRNIHQSGVLFLAYRFGLPVVATNVGSLREDIQEGRTGFVAAADDASDLARTIHCYFSSSLYQGLEEGREDIKNYASEKYSWHSIGKMTREVYERVSPQSFADEKASAVNLTTA